MIRKILNILISLTFVSSCITVDRTEHGGKVDKRFYDEGGWRYEKIKISQNIYNIYV